MIIFMFAEHKIIEKICLLYHFLLNVQEISIKQHSCHTVEKKLVK